jgi:hypothetical protein
MNDYFDHVERGLSDAVRRRAHLPWYKRLRPRVSRPAAVVVACLIAAGSALAATGVLRTGKPVGATVPAVPNAYDGVAIPGSQHLLALRVADPDGGPPWGLRILKTSRGLTCVQLGRVVDGRIGALGQDGAFRDDGAFHPFATNFLDGSGCGTDDARGDAFLNEQIHGLAASALSGDQQHISGGCYLPKTEPRSCPPGDLRDVYYGLLGPDATSVTHTTATGASTTTSALGRDGAYLVVLPHTAMPCGSHQLFCARGQRYSTGGPELEPSAVIRAVSYRNAPPCHLSTPAGLARLQATQQARFRAVLRARFPAIYRTVYHSERYVPGSLSKLSSHEAKAFEALRAPYLRAEMGVKCPAVGYVGMPARHLTQTQIASPVRAHLQPARFYCEKREQTVPCDRRVPPGYKRINMQKGPPQLLLVIEFTAHAAVTNFDSHYEINTTNPNDPQNPKCPGAGGGSFGPTQTNLHAGQRVRFTQFVDRECPGVSHITVGFVTVDGPSGSAPVPGLPGQSAEIPVGQTDVRIP